MPATDKRDRSRVVVEIGMHAVERGHSNGVLNHHILTGRPLLLGRVQFIKEKCVETWVK